MVERNKIGPLPFLFPCELFVSAKENSDFKRKRILRIVCILALFTSEVAFL